MKRVSLVLTSIAISLFIGTLAYAHGEPHGTKAKFTKHFRETFFAITEMAGFSIEVLPDEKEYEIGKNVTGIVIHDNHDEDVVGAVIDITAEGNSDKFGISDKGGGLYTVSALDLRREGNWKLTIQIRKKSETDRAVFVFPDVRNKFLPPGIYDTGSLK